LTISITIPVLNEADTLRSQVLKLLDFLKVFREHIFSVVIADNGSEDGTNLIGRALERDFPHCVKYLKVERRGVGLALRSSWLESQADIVGYMDLDFATDLNHIREVTALFECGECSIVNGSRLLSESKVINRSFIRELTSRAFNKMMRFLLKVDITDGMCGFKFFKRDVAIGLIQTGIQTDGWIFSTEILVKAAWAGHPICEIPVIWTDDRKSKVKILSLSKAYLIHLILMARQKKDWIKRYGKS